MTRPEMHHCFPLRQNILHRLGVPGLQQLPASLAKALPLPRRNTRPPVVEHCWLLLCFHLLKVQKPQALSPWHKKNGYLLHPRVRTYRYGPDWYLLTRQKAVFDSQFAGLDQLKKGWIFRFQIEISKNQKGVKSTCTDLAIF